MSIAATSSAVRGGVCIPYRSHITNECASIKVRTLPADKFAGFSYRANMARRGKPKGPVRWFLREWMDACGLSGRGSQARMMELTGWSKATMSQLYNYEQDYSPAILEAAAAALHCELHELLMPPERALAIRGMRANAAQIVKSEPINELAGRRPMPVADTADDRDVALKRA